MLQWQKMPELEAAYREGKRAVYRQAIARLQQGTSGGRHDVTEAADRSGGSASVNVRAAEAIFNHAAKAIEIEDIDAPVAALEATANKQRKGY